jgi:hypothetical protein
VAVCADMIPIAVGFPVLLIAIDLRFRLASAAARPHEPIESYPPNGWTIAVRCRPHHQTPPGEVLYISGRALVGQVGTWRKHDGPSSVPGAMESE